MWRSIILLIPLIQFAHAERYICPNGVEFVAQSMSNSQSKDFLFYGVQQNIESASQCAKLCYEMEFCRSAAYNHSDNTCHLAYANVMRCQDSGPAYRVKSINIIDQITAIYCIRCPDDQNPTQSTPQGVCFVEYEQKVLLYASFEIEKNVRLDECKCKCAGTWSWSSSSSQKCHSFQYFSDRNECVLNSKARRATSGDRLENGSDFIDIQSQKSSYYDFTCQDARAVAELISGYCKKFGAEKGLSIGPFSISSPPLDILKSKNTTDCFDQVDDHVLTGVAGGLEHDLNLDECKCLCAGSVESGKYDFQCKSVMYYRKERDCVLNLDDRFNRPELFRVASDRENDARHNYEVIYVGMTCQGDAIKKYTSLQCKKGSQIETSINREPTPVSIIEATIKVEPDKPDNFPLAPLQPQTPGEKTDDCFVEIPDYVLSGMAGAIEAGVTLDQCKCLCADSSSRYGITCLSLQYYSDVSTCLMNRKNRIQEPANFKKVVSSVPHTYLDYLCSDIGTKRDTYWIRKCIGQKLPQPTRNTTANVTATTATNAPSTPVPIPTPYLWSQTSAFPTSRLNSIFSINELNRTFTVTPINPPVYRPTPPIAQSGTTSSTGPCRYSAFYETEFTGRRMIERIVVGDPSICFQNCAQKHCKSANILSFLGKYKYCELFLDSSVDYPNTNMITYNAASAYFDGIECQRL